MDTEYKLDSENNQCASIFMFFFFVNFLAFLVDFRFLELVFFIFQIGVILFLSIDLLFYLFNYFNTLPIASTTQCAVFTDYSEFWVDQKRKKKIHPQTILFPISRDITLLQSE